MTPKLKKEGVFDIQLRGGIRIICQYLNFSSIFDKIFSKLNTKLNLKTLFSLFIHLIFSKTLFYFCAKAITLARHTTSDKQDICFAYIRYHYTVIQHKNVCVELSRLLNQKIDQ